MLNFMTHSSKWAKTRHNPAWLVAIGLPVIMLTIVLVLAGLPPETALAKETEGPMLCADAAHTLALEKDGSVWGWSGGYSWLSDDTSDTIQSPIHVQSESGEEWTRRDSGSRNDELINPALEVNYPLSIQKQSILGQKWVRQESNTNYELRGITWNGDQFVAVGHSGGWGVIIASPDGINWIRQMAGTGTYNYFYDVTWDGNQFVAVGGNGNWFHRKLNIFTSSDGEIWTSRDSGTNNALRGITWSGSQFVAVGNGGTILTSPDGVNWTSQESGLSYSSLILQDVTWSGSRYVAVGTNGAIFTSTDGENWTSQSSVTDHSLESVTWNGSQFVAVGRNGTIIASSNGENWTNINSGTDRYYNGVIWTGNQFVAVGYRSALFSLNGATWTMSDVDTYNWLNDVAWNGSQLVAVGAAGEIFTTLSNEEDIPPDKYTHRIAYIPVKHTEEPNPLRTVEQLKQRAQLVEQYYAEQSYGAVKMLSEFIFDEWVELSEEELNNIQVPDIISHWEKADKRGYQLIEAAVGKSNINADDYDAVVVVQAGPIKRSYTLPIGVYDPGITDWLPAPAPMLASNRVHTSDRSSFSVWAHELGHAVFKWYDYYTKTNYRGTRGNTGLWCLMGNGIFMRTPAPISSYLKALDHISWLEFKQLSVGDAVPIEYLMNLEYGDSIYRFETGDDSISAFIFEGRNPPDQMGLNDPWESGRIFRLLEEPGIMLYQVELKGEKNDEEFVYRIETRKAVAEIPFWKYGVGLPIGGEYIVDPYDVKFAAYIEDSQLMLKAKEYIPKNRTIWQKSLDILTTPLLTTPFFYNEETESDSYFDLDLKVYTTDGLKVGMDHDTGEYLMQIPGARSSGNIPGGGSEWISVPDHYETYYEIDTTPAKNWMKDAGVPEMELEIVIRTINYDQEGERTITEETIPIDLELSDLYTFSDVPTDHPFHDEIYALAASGITEGYPDGTFRPSNPVTRMAMAAFLYRGLNLEDPVVTEPTFSDVFLGYSFFTEIEALAAAEIVTGYPDGTFRPSDNVTRMATAAFLYRALNLADPGVTAPSFSDVPADHPFFTEIEALAASKITTGYPDGTFRPSDNVTRMAMAAFLVRALELED